MIVGSFYTFFKDLIVQYYYNIVSWFYVSVEVQEGDDCYKWLSGKHAASLGMELTVPANKKMHSSLLTTYPDHPFF